MFLFKIFDYLSNLVLVHTLRYEQIVSKSKLKELTDEILRRKKKIKQSSDNELRIFIRLNVISALLDQSPG